MSKKNVCETHKTFAVWSGAFGFGVELKFLEYGINDYIYYVGICGDKKTYHKSKVKHYKNGSPFFMWGACKIMFNECMLV